MGVIYEPVKDVLYFGDRELGAYRLENVLQPENKPHDINKVIAKATRLPCLNDSDPQKNRPFSCTNSYANLLWCIVGIIRVAYI